MTQSDLAHDVASYPQPLLELARSAAGEAATLIHTMRAEVVEVASTKSSSTDVVTRADLAAEALLRDRLLNAHPQDGFLGEEGEPVRSASGITWVVDPIDGTVNYLYGLPNYAVSVAAQDGDGTVVGVVVSPGLGEEYWASRGAGSFLNGLRLQRRSGPPLDQALVATGFGYEASVRAAQGKAAALLVPQVRDLRRLGSCALDICGVARGVLDAYVESGPQLWDHAAASLIATEAGASFRRIPGADCREVLVCGTQDRIHDFVSLVQACGF